MDTIYYYKTVSDTWHFSTGVTRDARRAVDYLRMLRYAKKQVVKLYLNNPDDFSVVKTQFYSPEYWAGRSWQDEYNEEKYYKNLKSQQ